MQATGGVNNKDIHAASGRGLQGVVGDGCGIGAGALGDDRDVVARPPGLQLFDSSGAEGVAGGKHDFFAFLLEVACQFADGGGFAGAVNAGHEDDVGFGAAGIKRLGEGRKQLLHVVTHGGFDGIHVFEFFAVDLLGDGVDDFGGDFDADVGSEQLRFEVVDKVLVECFFAEEKVGEAVPGFGESLTDAGKVAPLAFRFCLWLGCVVVFGGGFAYWVCRKHRSCVA